MIKNKRIMACFPILFGLFLGIISVIIGQIPKNIAQFSGMTMIGNEMGYIWSALIIAWVNSKNWRKSFYSSCLTLFTATFIYYFILVIFDIFDITLNNEPIASQLAGFVYWLVLGAVVALLASTIVWMARKSKSKLLNYVIFPVSYLGTLGVIFYYRGLFIIKWYNRTVERDGYDGIIRLSNYFTGLLYEVGFAFIVTTIIFAIGLKLVIKEKKQTNSLIIL